MQKIEDLLLLGVVIFGHKSEKILHVCFLINKEVVFPTVLCKRKLQKKIVERW